MTAPTPATALAAALKVAIGLAHEHTDAGFEIECATADFLRDHGPALAAALRDAERYRFLRKSTTAPLTSMTADEFDANVDSHMHRAADTTTRGTP